jgi:hypothetical protein
LELDHELVACLIRPVCIDVWFIEVHAYATVLHEELKRRLGDGFSRGVREFHLWEVNKGRSQIK